MTEQVISHKPLPCHGDIDWDIKDVYDKHNYCSEAHIEGAESVKYHDDVFNIYEADGTYNNGELTDVSNVVYVHTVRIIK